MSVFWKNTLIFLALTLFIAGANLYTIAWHGFYYQCYALAIVILSFVLNDFMKTIASKIMLWLAIFNLMDEIFFDPTTNSVWEYIVCAVVAISIIIKHQKNGRYK